LVNLIVRKFEDINDQDVDALLGSLTLGIKNKWLVDKSLQDGIGKVSFALKYSLIEPGKLYPMHRSEHIEALVVLDGNGTVKGEKEEFNIGTGDVVLTRCGEIYSIRNLGKSGLKTLICVDLLSHL
jgi:mannose-6-phosphate isomerase-like protein (cupin superfamily)